MRLCVLVSGALGNQIVRQLADLYKIDCVFTDKNSTVILEFCKASEIDVFVGNPRAGKALKFCKGRNVDVLVSVNYLFLIEEDLINLPTQIAFNVHGSLLPKYRGRTPHVWSVINGERTTGVTGHVLDAGCDTGDIIEQRTVEISSEDTGQDVLYKFQQVYPDLVLSILKSVEMGTLKRMPQIHERATYFGKRTPSDGKINWDRSKERIRNWVRAQSNPYPGAFTMVGDKKIIIDEIVDSDMGYNYEMPNGLVLEKNPKILVKATNGVVELCNIRENKCLIEKGGILR